LGSCYGRRRGYLLRAGTSRAPSESFTAASDSVVSNSAIGHEVERSAAISHDARPRLHPVSPDVLETGMVFNIEPAVYISGYAGLRQCSMVLLGAQGPEVLTSFQENLETLVR